MQFTSTVLALLLACGGPVDPSPGGTADTADTGPGPSDNTADTADSDDTGDTAPVDADGDGFSRAQDCDDSDASVFPGATEVCGDGVVNDCDGTEEAAAAWCDGTVGPDEAMTTWSGWGGFHDDWRFAGVGDLNGDGHDDVVAGNPLTNGNETGDPAIHAGGLFIFHGPLEPDYPVGTQDHQILGTQRYDCIGWDLLGIGDTNQDGYDDFVVGASDELWGTITDTPAVYRIDGPAVIDSIDEALALVQGNPYTDCLGSVLTTVPDQDGDGARDLLVGGQCAGEVHLLSGGSNTTLAPGVDDIATFAGPSGDSRFGHAMASGDFDGDGLVDIAIGAPEIDLYPSNALGFVSVFSGPAGGVFTENDADTTIAAITGDSLGQSRCAAPEGSALRHPLGPTAPDPAALCAAVVVA